MSLEAQNSQPERSTRVRGPRRALMLAGPTGIGKTALAVGLCESFGLEIISADSMQVYRGMPIGTAQPTPQESERARFHLCGLLDPGEPFNVQRFVGLCEAAHHDIQSRGRQPIYVGGTGMYLRALRWGLFEEPASDPAVRARLDEALRSEGPQTLHERLAQVDPVSAGRVAPGDGVRIVRALEVLEVTGQPLAHWQSQWAEPQARFPHVLVVLNAPREVVRERIARRTDAMLEAGWIDEVAALLARGIPPTAHCFKALGYREIIEHLEGKMDRAALRDRIVTITGQFAKRQLTWMRRERRALWLDVDPARPAALRERLEQIMTRQGYGAV